jgi:uncharacterized protein
MLKLDDSQRQRLADVCRRYQVAELYVFGSLVTGEAGNDSDVDLLVRYSTDEVAGAFERYMQLKEELETLFARPVDLLTLKTFRNPVFQAAVDAQKTLVYAA